VKVGEEAGKVLGVAVSKEMAETIAKRAKDLKISISASALLSLPDVMEGKDAFSFLPKVLDLMKGVASGSIPAREGVEAISKAFSLVAAAAESAGAVGDAVLGALAEQARLTGLRVPEIQKMVIEAEKAGATGLAALWKSIDTDAENAGTRISNLSILTQGSFESLRAQGVSAAEAYRILGPAIDAAIERAQAAGVELKGFMAEAAKIRQFQKDNPVLVETADAINAVSQATLRAGRATQEQINAMIGEVLAYRDAAAATGADSSTYLAQIAPTLARLAVLAREGKVELDEQTQAMIRDAEAAGLLEDALGPQEQMIELLREITATLKDVAAAWGAIPAERTTRYNIHRTITGDDHVPQGEPDYGDLPGMAVGGIVMPRPGGVPVRVAGAGEPELAAPVRAFSRQLAGDLAKVVGNAGGGGDVYILVDSKTGSSRQISPAEARRIQEAFGAGLVKVPVRAVSGKVA
jgi:hypothetical protein